MLRRTILGGLLLAAVVLVSASAAISATTAATKPKLVFMTELDWTRTGTILQSSDGVECRVDVSMVGHGGPFYTARSRAPRNTSSGPNGIPSYRSRCW